MVWKKSGTFEVRHHRHLFIPAGDIAGHAELLRVAGTLVAHGQVRGQRGRSNSRGVAEPVEKGRVKCLCALLVVSRTREIDEGRKGVGAIEAGIAIEDIERSSREKTATDENNETDAKLQTDQESLAEPATGGACNGGATLMQGFLLRDAQRLAQRIHAAQQGDRSSDRGREEQECADRCAD